MFRRDTSFQSPLLHERGRGSATVPGWFTASALIGFFFLLALPSPVHAQQQPGPLAGGPRPIAPALRTFNRKTGERASSALIPRRGVLAADRRVLPAGAVVHLNAGEYTGTYTVFPTPLTRTAAQADFRRYLHELSHARGLVPGRAAADSRPRPVGTRVRLEAGAYTGGYLVADTGGAVRGRKIDIWMPSAHEAMRFGRRPVKLTVLAECNPALLRDDLEKKYVGKKITAEEYRVQDREVSRLADQVYAKAAKHLVESGKQFQNASYSPNKVEPDAARKKTFLDTFYERVQLEFDRERKVITEEEYEYRKQHIIRAEKEIARGEEYSRDEVADYYEKVSHFPKEVKLVAQSGGQRPPTLERFYPWAALLLGLLGTLLTFFVSLGKYRRDTEAQKKDMELKEVQARETVEKTSLLLRIKELQVEEMKLKVLQLEQQVVPKQKSLIVVQESVGNPT